MDTLLNVIPVKVKEWKSLVAEIESGTNRRLREGEDKAFYALRDYWKNSHFNPEICQKHLKTIKDNARYHPGGWTELKLFQRICVDYYTRDKDAFIAFQKAMGEGLTATRLKASPTTLSFEAKGVSKTVKIETDGVSYEVTNTAHWCRIVNKTETFFQIKCQDNTGAERSCNIIVKSGSLEVSVLVKQKAAVTLQPAAQILPPTSQYCRFCGRKYNNIYSKFCDKCGKKR